MCQCWNWGDICDFPIRPSCIKTGFNTAVLAWILRSWADGLGFLNWAHVHVWFKSPQSQLWSSHSQMKCANQVQPLYRHAVVCRSKLCTSGAVLRPRWLFRLVDVVAVWRQRHSTAETKTQLYGHSMSRIVHWVTPVSRSQWRRLVEKIDRYWREMIDGTVKGLFDLSCTVYFSLYFDDETAERIEI